MSVAPITFDKVIGSFKMDPATSDAMAYTPTAIGSAIEISFRLRTTTHNPKADNCTLKPIQKSGLNIVASIASFRLGKLFMLDLIITIPTVDRMDCEVMSAMSMIFIS